MAQKKVNPVTAQRKANNGAAANNKRAPKMPMMPKGKCK